MNLAALGQIGSAFGGALPAAEMQWQKVLAGREALAQAQRAKQAADARIAALTTPDAFALPQQGPPGITSMQAPAAASSAPQAGGATPSLPLGPGGAPAYPTPNGAAPVPSAPALTPVSMTSASPSPAPGGAPAPRPGAAPTGSTLTIPDPMQRLRAMAMAIKRANPGIDNLTLATALDQQVKLARGIAPDDRALLQAETAIMRVQAQSDTAVMRANNARDAANIRAESAQQIADLRRQIAEMQDKTKQRGQDIASRDRSTAEAGRNARSDAKIKARAALAAGQEPDQQTMHDIAEARSYGDTSVMSLGWSGQARTKIMGMAAKMAKDRGTTLQQEDARYAGQKTAATTVGRISGATAQGAQEIQRFVPLITGISNKIDRTRFPTVNSVVLAARRGTGDPDVVKLNSYIQSAKNAYVLIMTRSGRSTDQARARSDELISPNMPVQQIGAALEAMANEAAVAQGAAGGAMGEVTGRIGGGQAAGGPPVPAADYTGQTIQGPDGSTWTSDGKTWTRQQ